MSPSSPSTGGPADPHDDIPADGHGDVVDVVDVADVDDGGIDYPDASFVPGAEDDDGLAPEAGRRRPSVLSVLLLVAGAIWIVVALLKIGDGPGSQTPPVAIGEQVDSGSAVLPDVETTQAPAEDSASLEGDTQLPPEPENSAENGGVVETPELVLEPEDGNPASERGPPAASMLAGKRWPDDYVAPDVVKYTIKRGGSMKNVANLYKIYHHEIEALNPGVTLEGELPPGSAIVVYRRKPGISSQSVGYPGAGSVEGGMPMIDGPGRILRHTPWKAWATEATVATLDLVLREWARRYPSEQVIIVGNMSARNGGRLKPHSSHQSGRDVDLSYPQKWDHKSELAPQVMNKINLERNLTWSLLELLSETGAVEAIFIDTSLQRLLYEYALETGRYSKKQLESWMEYPRSPGSGSPMIKHVRGHVDHLHVRLDCSPKESRCASREL